MPTIGFMPLANGTATPEQLSSSGRISLVVVLGIVLALVGVAVQVLPPKSRLLAVVVACLCYVGIAELVVWYLLPGDFPFPGFLIGAPILVVFFRGYLSGLRHLADYLPRIRIRFERPRKTLWRKAEEEPHLPVKLLPRRTFSSSASASQTETQQAELTENVDYVANLEKIEQAQKQENQRTALVSLIRRGESLIRQIDALEEEDRLMGRYQPTLALGKVAKRAFRYSGGGPAETNLWLYNVATYIREKHTAYSAKIIQTGIQRGPLSAEREAIEHNLTILREIRDQAASA